MDFFRKSHDNTPKNEPKQRVEGDMQSPAGSPAQELQQPTAATLSASNPNAEEAACQWWREKYGTDMPSEVARWIKELTRAEAHRLHVASSLLTPQQMSRVKDQLHLQQTKLDNIENSIIRIYEQKDWVRRFQELNHNLTEHRNRMYQVNKQVSAIANEEKEMNRFEAFETIHGTFDRLHLLETLSRANKEEQSRLSNTLDEIQRMADEQEKLQTQTQDNLAEAEKQMLMVYEQNDQMRQMKGANDLIAIDLKWLSDATARMQENRAATQGNITEQETELEQLQKKITEQSTKRQAMEPHQQMLEHVDGVMARLDRLYEIKQELAQLKNMQSEVIRRQNEENELLGRVFSQYQEVDNTMKSMNDELHMHRQMNLGHTSYSLQERAMKLKSRREKLLSAQSLWNRIQLGYNLIEENSREVNRLRLDIDNLKQNLDQLEEQLGPMRRLCHEKEYTLTLSKSQNVIQLRGDLREGTSCTVCGATHHPYHSDTMLDQNKLISEIRTEFELLQAELIAKEQTLLDLRLQYSAQLARHEVEERSLSALRQRQLEDVKEWKVYRELDRSFEECSSSTNLDARTALLRQLIENTAKDAELAQSELDQYNFHQSRINEISEEISRKEQKKSDLTVRLNEVNTGCQVMAGRVERVQQRYGEMQQNYSNLYEEIMGQITLPEWYNEWQQNHEGLKMRLNQMRNNWVALNESISTLKRQEEVLQTSLEANRQSVQYMDTLLLSIRDNAEQRKAIQNDNQKSSERILGDMEIKDYFEYNLRHLQDAVHAQRQQNKATTDALLQQATMRGQQTQLVETCQQLDDNAVAERSQLDIWMRKFNANNPPVQYAELERVFTQNKDWSGDREKIRAIRLDAILEEKHVDALRSQIVSLQAEGKRPSNAEHADVMESLVSQLEVLEKRRQEVMMQIAEQRIALQNHEKCTAQLKAEEEELYKNNI